MRSSREEPVDAALITAQHPSSRFTSLGTSQTRSAPACQCLYIGCPVPHSKAIAHVPTRAACRFLVSFLLIAWAESASVEQSLLGCGACTLADNPVLDAALLNDSVLEVCAPGETVQLRTDDSVKPISQCQLWQAPRAP